MSKASLPAVRKMRRLPIGQVHPAPWNYKEDDDAKTAAFADSLKRNGFIYPIVVSRPAERKKPGPFFEVCDGNHRLEACRLLKMPMVPVIDVGPLPRAARKKLGLELNEWKWTVDPIALAECFSDVVKVDPGFRDVGPFSPKEAESFETLLANVKLAPPSGSPREPAARSGEGRIAGSYSAREKMTFSVDAKDLAVVRGALDVAKKRGRLSSDTAAFVFVCERFVQTEGGE